MAQGVVSNEKTGTYFKNIESPAFAGDCLLFVTN